MDLKSCTFQDGEKMNFVASPVAQAGQEDLQWGAGKVQKSLRHKQEALYTEMCAFAFEKSRDENKGLDHLLNVLRELKGLVIISTHPGSLTIRVACLSLETLERLWHEYRSGHLQMRAGSCFVTEEFLSKFGLKEVKLTVEISEEEYKSCRRGLRIRGE